MAAVLCNGISQCCQGLCQLLALPCKACGKACGGCCNAIGEACSGCCTVLGKVCCTSPFTPYVLVTVACQVAPVLWGILTLLDPADECGFLNVWMLVMACLSIAHIGFVFYIAYRMAEEVQDERNTPGETYGSAQQQGSSPPQQQDSSPPPRGKYIWDYVNDLFTNTSHPRQQRNDAPPPVSPQQEQRGGSNSWKRLGHLMCYDLGVAIYIVVFIFWAIWLPIGISTLVSTDDEDDEDCERVSDYAQGAIICGFVYGVLVALCFCCSLIFLKV